MLKKNLHFYRDDASLDEEDEDDFEEESEDLEEEESEPDSDTEELRCDELEEFRNANVDCASGDIVFIDDSGEITDGDQSLDARCDADTNGDMDGSEQNDIDVSQVLTIADVWTHYFCQHSLPSFEPTSNPNNEREAVQMPGVSIDVDSSPFAQTVRETELVKEPAMTEGRGSWKRRGKHPTTLYECDCGEIISGGEVEDGEGLIECNKAGCETRWVSLQRDVEILSVTHRDHKLHSFT